MNYDQIMMKNVFPMESIYSIKGSLSGVASRVEIIDSFLLIFLMGIRLIWVLKRPVNYWLIMLTFGRVSTKMPLFVRWRDTQAANGGRL